MTSAHKQPLRTLRPVYAELLFVAGLILISLGITFMVHADLGISVASSVPFVISLRFQALSFGTWSYIVQGFLVLLLIAIIRRAKPSYAWSFLVSVAFGLLVDLFVWLTAALATGDLVLRALYFAIGLFVLTLGIALVVFSGLPCLPYDLFVKELAVHKQISFRTCKTLFDLSCLTLSSLFLFFFVHRLAGIGVGSILSALLNGTMAGFWLRIFQSRFRPVRLVRFRSPKVGQDRSA